MIVVRRTLIEFAIDRERGTYKVYKGTYIICILQPWARFPERFLITLKTCLLEKIFDPRCQYFFQIKEFLKSRSQFLSRSKSASPIYLAPDSLIVKSHVGVSFWSHVEVDQVQTLWAVVVAQLVEQSLLAVRILSLAKFYLPKLSTNCIIEKTKMNVKRPGMAHLYKRSVYLVPFTFNLSFYCLTNQDAYTTVTNIITKNRHREIL